jgi:predicted alpha/beta-hydrolase family hydrolase
MAGLTGNQEGYMAGSTLSMELEVRTITDVDHDLSKCLIHRDKHARERSAIYRYD